MKNIEQSLQSKEENLLTELKHVCHLSLSFIHSRFQKDTMVENLRHELQITRANYDAAQNENRELKAQRYIATTNSPSITAAVNNDLFFFFFNHIISFRMNHLNYSNNLHLHFLQSLSMFVLNLLMTSVNQVKKDLSKVIMQ